MLRKTKTRLHQLVFVVSSVCKSAVERITELEDLLEKVKQGKIKWVDYDAGEDCYEDEHKGHWEEVK